MRKPMTKPLALNIEDDLSSEKLYERLFRIGGDECRLCSTYKEAHKSLGETTLT
jgi:hypothetical protein